ncbi:MAG: L-2-hydroxyglutarate oxidase [Bdellovibrionaceae bacterium]|nr:L-2-hydroxyglutarate oxidase [Pseudobdellovibrionaceae bacterium]
MKNKIVIIGGGVVGLATAYQLLQAGKALNVTVLEKEPGPGGHQTSHNSGVIHSGLYYKPGSLKALNCIRGYDLLLNFCKNENIAFDLCGKIVVASDEAEIPQLEVLWKRGEANGLKGLKLISESEMKEIEPHVVGKKGIWVPQTGIIAFKDVAEKLVRKIESLGGQVLFNQKVVELHSANGQVTVSTNASEHQADYLINCAGLFCDRIARMMGQNSNVKIIPFRGEYWELKPERAGLVKNLIYPVPNPNFPFLGVHFTRMIKGGVELGPNAVLAFKREGYTKLDISLSDLADVLTWPGFHKIVKKYWRDGASEMYRSYSKAAFAKAAQKLIPDVQVSDLVPGGSGVRAQACDINGNLLDDFSIVYTENCVHVLNAPSPAATSSLAIGERISGEFVKKYLS